MLVLNPAIDRKTIWVIIKKVSVKIVGVVLHNVCRRYFYHRLHINPAICMYIYILTLI